MKKILFNDKYGLTEAVLQGRKTMTRRMVKDGTPLGNWGETEKYAKYKIGEVVAVAQSYKSVFEESLKYAIPKYHWLDDHIDEIGYKNKMFVKADLMPHQIRITDIKMERLQDISEEDVYREGFRHEFLNNGWKNAAYHEEAVLVYYDDIGRSKQICDKEPKEAFSFLIDLIFGVGTWESNPWVFAYEFKLIK